MTAISPLDVRRLEQTPAEELFATLDADPEGLSGDEAVRRL